LNVKRVTFAASSDALVTLTAKPNFRTLGKKFGKHTNEAAGAVRAFGSDVLVAFERGGELAVTAGGETHVLTADDLVVERQAAGSYVIAQDGGRFAAIDPTVSDALRAEGLARDVISRVQRLRKERGLAVSDRIRLGVAGAGVLEAAVRTHHAWIAGEVLATEISVGDGATAPDAVTDEVDGHEVRLTLTRIS
jgi:isoleucyl-tRNA synthetase